MNVQIASPLVGGLSSRKKPFQSRENFRAFWIDNVTQKLTLHNSRDLFGKTNYVDDAILEYGGVLLVTRCSS